MQVTKPKVLIVSHDAGGAEVLSAWCLEHQSWYSISLALAGPALKVFQRDFGLVNPVDLSVVAGFSGGDFVLTGSSLESDWERNAIAECKRRRVFCASFLDHWDLYRERFDTSCGLDAGLPDEIWVGDEYGMSYAKTCGFPESKLKLEPNPSFMKIIRWGASYLSPSGGERGNILYICEPISRKLGAAFGELAGLYDDEREIMRKFLVAAGTRAGGRLRVTLRLHPAEKVDKYEDLVQQYGKNLLIHMSTNKTLAEDVMEHDVVIGVESMGLVIAMLLGKPVYSCITGRQWKISLPQQEIKRVFSFDNLFETLSFN